MPDITMPQLGETVTEGTITRWFKQVGEEVAEDEPLFEVSTDKVDSEVPSSASGFLSEILVQEGQTVDVGAKLAVISAEPPADGAAGDGAGAGAEASNAPEAGEDTAPTTEAGEQEPAGTDDGASPPQASEAEADGETETEAAQPPAGGSKGGAEPSTQTAGKLLSPVVRRLISEHGLDLGQISGTGQGGRITRTDVLAHIDNDTQGKSKDAPADAPPRAQQPAAPATRKPAAPAPKAGADDEVLPFNNIRRRTAEHMIRSQATSAHVLVAAEVDYAAVEVARQSVGKEFKAKEGFSLTYLPFIARAVIDALGQFPHVNASVGDNELIVHKRVHLSIAVDLNFEGLIVPVVHDADQMRLRALARQIADLAARARSRELSSDDISGGTFTITNPGPFGTFLTFPVINQPQVAILSTDGIRKRPVAIQLPDGSDAVAVHPVGMLGLSFDHRAFDGAYASAFLGRVKENIETRDWSAEL